MSRQRREASDTVRGCIVTVCRGCCCGTRKHPDVDHTGQARELRAAVARGGRFRVTDCLDLCESSNVVVVSPSAAGRRAGGRPVWVGDVLHPEVVGAIVGWIAAGGPGTAQRPAELDHHILQPSRRVRAAAER
ncbi:MAG TPA: (2Fe-2S) ferredoxin domain-containing protein [Mycobacteriales bacterium]